MATMKGIPLMLPRLGITPAASSKLFLWQPGTTTKQPAYTDETLAVQISNPLTANSAGLFAAIYLDPNLGYKVALYPSTEVNDPPSGTATFTQDNLYLPAMRLPTVLSKVFADSPYTVTTADGFDILIEVDATGGAVTINLFTAVGNTGKQVTVIKTDSGANAVTIDPSGAETVNGQATYALAAQYESARLESDGSAWLVGGQSRPRIDPLVCQGRPTLESGVPVSSADQTAKTTIYFTPYGGSTVALYSTSAAVWRLHTVAEVSLPLTGLAADTNFDLFLYDNAGTKTLESVAWTSATVRATALVLQNGVLVKTGAANKRYVATFRTTGSVGQCEDSVAKRFVWSYYHRTRRPLRRLETTATWVYSSQTIHQANASTSNQVAVVIGVAEVAVDLRLLAHGANDTLTRSNHVGIGEDSTTVFSTNGPQGMWTQPVANHIVGVTAGLTVTPAIGYHFYAWLEATDAVGVTTWTGVSATGALRMQSGLTGSVEA